MPQGRAINQGLAFRQFLSFLQSSGQFNKGQALRVAEIENRSDQFAYTTAPELSYFGKNDTEVQS